MGVLIPATTAAQFSEPFSVEPGVKKGLIASGLAGVETATLQVKLSDGTWKDTTSVMTATEPEIRVEANTREPIYRVSKSATAGAAFVDSL